MNDYIFGTQEPLINKKKLRIPQYEAYYKIRKYYEKNKNDREISVILPVGCGKSGLITLIPFAVKSHRTLVVAPNVKISGQLYNDFDMSNPDMFYIKCSVLDDSVPFPEAVEIRGTKANKSDLDNADVVITNIQQLQGEDNRWLNFLPSNYFDLIIFDEAHHNVANSWVNLRENFPNAKIVNLSATPTRADGQVMSGKIIYSYSVCQAIKEGYVKRLKALVLNPKTLKFVREDNGKEVEVPLEEVIRLGEEDSDFRRSIVTSKETLNTIVDASIRELMNIRNSTGDKKHKIIASALNYKHCIQITKAYSERGLRAAYIHSRENSATNEKVLQKLDNNELDVIVQVRKLGEGFDHPYLSVAAIFSVFNNLSPFIQFIGRIMRAIEQNNPTSIQNRGTVVFHAGANIAKRWTDFQQFSQADQKYFNQLLPVEDLDFSSSDELYIQPNEIDSSQTKEIDYTDSLQIIEQKDIYIKEIPLLKDEEVKNAFNVFMKKGISPDQYRQAYEKLKPIKIPKAKQRQANRKELDELIKNEVGKLLHIHDVNPAGKDLDTKHLGKSNFVVLKSAIDKKIDKLVGTTTKARHEMSQEQLSLAKSSLTHICGEVEKEVF